VLPSARKFRELGVSTAKTIELPAPLSLSLRTVRREDGAQPPASEGEVVQAESRFR
jgi:hypothetical protein